MTDIGGAAFRHPVLGEAPGRRDHHRPGGVRPGLDGGDRSKVASFEVDVEPRVATVWVPRKA